MAENKPDHKFDNRGFRTGGLGLAVHTNLAQGINVGFQDNFRLQDELVSDRGEVVVVETALACPKCRKGDRDDPIFFFSACDNCEGNGFMYRQARYMAGIITSITQSRDLGEFGFAAPGDCVMSPAPNDRPHPSQFDRITFTWPQSINEGQVVVRGADYGRFQERGGENRILENEDVLHYQAANALYVEDEDGTEYYEDADFIFENKVVRWVGDRPAIRKRYVIKYEAYLQWIVVAPPMERRDSGENMGPRVLLRKVHLFQTVDDPKEETSEEKASKALFGGTVTV